MGKKYGFGNPKNFKERKERKIDNLLQQYPRLQTSQYFKHFCTEIERIKTEQFKIYLDVEFINFKANLRYIQKISGFNQDEFCRTVGLSKNALTNSQQFPTTIPLHSFKKSYSVMLYFLPTIEFCDMFNISFEQTFPLLREQEQGNRDKLNKAAGTPLGFAKHRKQAA